MLFWHVGGTLAITRYSFRDDRMDVRLLVVGALLPDLIDTPIGLLWYGALGSVRLVAHSLLFGALLMVIVVARTRRGRPRKRWMPLAIGVLIHMFLDAMWADPETLLWPFLGVDITGAGVESVGELVTAILTDWKVWALEATGLAYLTYLAVAGKMTRGAGWRRFAQTGRIELPIDRR